MAEIQQGVIGGVDTHKDLHVAAVVDHNGEHKKVWGTLFNSR
ncbi:hypothetical protein [Xenorhabdus bovienii]|nr:hypothetical protein [Xenorhabdus bovienii]